MNQELNSINLRLTVFQACINLLKTTLDEKMSSSKADEIVRQVLFLMESLQTSYDNTPRNGGMGGYGSGG